MWLVLLKVLAWIFMLFDAFCPKEVIEKDGVKAVSSAEELYAACNVVSLHIPATAETKIPSTMNWLTRCLKEEYW